MILSIFIITSPVSYTHLDVYKRQVYETPGGTILYKAHELLEMITLDRDTSHYKKLVAEKYGELVYNGQWFSPPVSYTHLDSADAMLVMKCDAGLLSLSNDESKRADLNGDGKIDSCDAVYIVRIAAGLRVPAVSYTHLDVYKRQPVCRRCDG